MSLDMFLLSFFRPFIEQYTWGTLGQTVAEVRKVPVAELRTAFAESWCAAHSLARCTSPENSSAVAWTIVFFMILIWLFCGGKRHLLGCWLTVLR